MDDKQNHRRPERADRAHQSGKYKRVVFRSLKSWSAIPDTQTLPAPTSGQAFQLSRIAPTADKAEISRREIYAGIRGCAAAYQARPDPPVRTVPWDDSGQA